MIPTAYKWALSSLLSYPLGAKNISDALEGVPQFDLLSLRFHPSEENPHRVESPFLVLLIGYRKLALTSYSSNAMIEEGWYGPRWEINVGAVPRSLRHAVRMALLQEGLPTVRKWLEESAGATGREGRAWIRVWYDLEQESLSYKSSVLPL